jgi:hypothetical protein
MVRDKEVTPVDQHELLLRRHVNFPLNITHLNIIGVEPISEVEVLSTRERWCRRGTPDQYVVTNDDNTQSMAMTNNKYYNYKQPGYGNQH